MADRRVSGRACRVVVLASGGGSNLAALLAASADPDYGATVVAVGADRDSIGALDIAAEAGVPTFVERVSEYAERADWDHALTERTAAHDPDLVVSAGFLKLVGPEFLARFGDRYINTHNSLLPSFPGMNGPRDALAYGVKVAGATLFFVDEGVDTGPIIAQAAVPVLDDDTEDTLTERIKVAERAQLVEYVGRLAREGWTINERRVTIAVTEVRTPVRRALISVYDKTGLEELARGLAEAGVEIVSTGSTAARIADAGVAVTRVEELTGFPECLDGRVKTLHPAVHAGLLADVRHDSHREQLADLGIDAFTLLVSNLYPFAQTVASGAGPDDVVEQIDIGGPSMVRGAAKNHANVAVVVDPARYGDVLAAVRAGGFTLAERQRLAAEAFVHTATYDVHVASWMSNVLAPAIDAPAASPDEAAEDAADAAGASFPSWIGATWQRASVLRYGENPHQKAALYVSESGATGLAGAEQLHGKEMSYNNYVDADAAWRCAHDFDQPAVAVIKHANPCGIAVGADIAEAHRKANATDPVSAYGGVIAANGIVTEEAAQQIGKVFTEVVVAPGFEPAAVELLAQKKNIRLLRVGAADADAVESRRISGGLLVQQVDRVDAAGDDPAAWTLAAGAPADDATLADLVFAWRASRSVKSNAILLASGGAAVGVGMGQVNRVDAARLAVERAADRAAGSVAASDAYFPFDDGARVLMEAGVRALVQPGGSVRDEDVVAAADEYGVTMYFTGSRHFFH